MVPPLAVDIDGTLSRADRSIDPRVLDALRAYGAPVVLATGKALPFPIALCDFAGIPETVVAENGGLAYVEDDLHVLGDREAANAVVAEYEAAGFALGWGEVDLVNRWRETEVAVQHDQPVEPLREIATRRGLEVVDSGYAYHVKSPDLNKGAALDPVADALGVDPGAFAAIGDSENDVELFEVAGRAFAVGNADDRAKRAADVVTEAAYADGFLEALAALAG
jgi:hypothetical protein